MPYVMTNGQMLVLFVLAYFCLVVWPGWCAP